MTGENIIKHFKQVCIHKSIYSAIQYAEREAEKKEAIKACDALLYNAWVYYVSQR